MEAAKDQHRELVSQLLSSLHAEWLPLKDIARGFEVLLARLDDLAIDNPRAVEQLQGLATIDESRDVRALAHQLWAVTGFGP